VKVLVACEESQAVTIELRKLGHEAFSCDIEPCSGGHPEWHLQQDVVPLLKEKWDMIIAFPPCTHLAVSGAAWFEQKRKDGRQQEGIDFFMLFATADCEKIAIENPVGIMSTVWRKPDQIVQPWQFGDEFQKSTCLWLKGLPKLEPTKIVGKGEIFEWIDGKSGKKKRQPKWFKDAWSLSAEERAKIRSKTFPGIAKAIAEQWGGAI
jgi:site-specific DNA-cytosine methylase